jgi:probable DNA metabolism protein
MSAIPDNESWGWDGSLDALLLLVDRSIELGLAPRSVILEGLGADGAEVDLFAQEAAFSASHAASPAATGAAARVIGLSRRLYAAALKTWMSEEGRERDLLAVAATCGRIGDDALADYGRPELSRLAAAVRRVTREIHLLEGFSRFSLVKDGRWVAWLEPRHNVLPALAPFFQARFGDEPFALVDLTRGYGILSATTPEGTGLECIPAGGLPAFEPDESDEAQAELWRSYFRAMENLSRRNPRLQRALMPAHYWKRLTEVQGMPLPHGSRWE